MIVDLHRWQCESQGCRSSALGVGSPIGLRGLGWKVEIQANGIYPASIKCPLHFQEEALTTPKERLEAAHSYATFFQNCRLSAPVDGARKRKAIREDLERTQTLRRLDAPPGPG